MAGIEQITNSDSDIIIVGGGMVGCSLACALATNPDTEHLSITIVEAGKAEPRFSPEQFDARVVALSNTSVQFLTRIGVWDDVVNLRASAYTEMHVWDADGTADIHFDCHEIREKQLGFIVENSAVLSALRRRVQSFKQVSLLSDTRVQDISLAGGEGKEQSVFVEQKGGVSLLKTSVIVGADGAHSTVRKIVNVPTKEWDYGHTAIVTTVTTSAAHQGTARQCFRSSGPIAFLPLGDEINASQHQRNCSLVWSAENDLAARLIEMSDAQFCAELGKAFEHKLGDIVAVDTRYAIPLRQRHAPTYVYPGLALVGDAAHTIHPLAGQGVNLGLYDVIALSTEIARSQQREFALDDFSILQRYERERQSHNLLAMTTMEGFKRLFAVEQPAVRWLRNVGMRIFNEQAWLKKKLISLASG